MALPDILSSMFSPFRKKSEGSYKHLGLSESAELVDFVTHEFDRVVEIETDDIQRASDAWKLFTGFKNGQYLDPKVVAEMEKEGRNPFQGNFIRSKVEGLAGSIIKNFFDIGFEPVDGDMSLLTRYITELMMIDKELLDWSQADMEFLIDGLVHRGCQEIFISDRYHPLGNIGFRRILPGHILLDPDWVSNNSWELKKAWKVAYLNVKQIKDIYDTKSEEIETYIQMKRGQPMEFERDDDSKGFPHYSLQEQYGDRYRVIEYKHIEREKKKIEFHIDSGLIIPEGTTEFKQQWAELNKIDLNDGVMSRTENIDVLYVTSICPQISRNLVLEDKKSKIQIGRLDIFPWSSARYNGVDSGIPELLKSLQQTYNKRESQIDYMIATSASGGVAMDPDIVDGNQAAKENIEQNWNKPNLKFWTAPGALASGRQFFQQLPKNQVDFGIVNELTRMVEMSDRISKQPAAMEGRSEGSEETGILYARKEMRAEVAQAILLKSYEQVLNEKGEAYVLLAKQLYSGVYREFNAIGSGRKIELNKPIITPSGEVIENDISQLPRMKVMITQSPEGVTNRLVDRSNNLELLRVLGPDSPIQRARATGNAMKTLNTSKEDKAAMIEDSELELALARETVKTQLLGLQAQQMQLAMQLQQNGQPMMPGMENPQGGGGGQQQSPQQAQGNPQQEVQGNNMSAQGLQ